MREFAKTCVEKRFVQTQLFIVSRFFVCEKRALCVVVLLIGRLDETNQRPSK